MARHRAGPRHARARVFRGNLRVPSGNHLLQPTGGGGAGDAFGRWVPRARAGGGGETQAREGSRLGCETKKSHPSPGPGRKWMEGVGFGRFRVSWNRRFSVPRPYHAQPEIWPHPFFLGGMFRRPTPTAFPPWLSHRPPPQGSRFSPVTGGTSGRGGVGRGDPLSGRKAYAPRESGAGRVATP